jgi:hypothetical protein
MGYPSPNHPEILFDPLSGIFDNFRIGFGINPKG